MQSVTSWTGLTTSFSHNSLGRIVSATAWPTFPAEFSKVRFRGDETKAKAVYEGVDALTPDDIAECVLFAVTRPLRVNIDEIVVKALSQSSGARIVRN